MFIQDQSTFTAAKDIELVLPPVGRAPHPKLTGLTAGTMIETSTGWRSVETLEPGDEIYTFDGGLRPLRRVNQMFLTTGADQLRRSGLVLVPGGVLGACAPLELMPDQHLLVQGRAVDALMGVPAALIPARAFTGLMGIRFIRATAAVCASTLEFDDEEAIWANNGMLFHCAGRDAAADGSGYFKTVTGDTALTLAKAVASESSATLRAA